MNLWQDLAAAALILAAVVYIVRRLRRMGRAKAEGCLGCRQCDPAAQEPPLVGLQPPSPSDQSDRG